MYNWFLYEQEKKKHLEEVKKRILDEEMDNLPMIIQELDDVEDLAELTKYINAVSSISFSIDRNKELSNGDQVIVSVSYDSVAAQAAGVNFGEQSSKIFEVKGLKK